MSETKFHAHYLPVIKQLNNYVNTYIGRGLNVTAPSVCRVFDVPLEHRDGGFKPHLVFACMSSYILRLSCAVLADDPAVNKVRNFKN
jgi:hypothetical protein